MPAVKRFGTFAASSRRQSARPDGDKVVRGWAHARAMRALAALATLSLAAAGAAHYAGGAMPLPGAAKQPASMKIPPSRSAAPPTHMAQVGESWPRSLFEGLLGISPQREPRRSDRPQDRQSPHPQSQRRQSTTPDASGGERQRQGGASDTGNYRTMCVRLCDGFYWPISFATRAANFARDSKICSQSCGSPAALYYYRNPGGEPEDMVSLDGQSYKSLRTAFLHRTAYDADCKCRPHPWETAAIERHRGYAQLKRARAASRNQRQAR